MLEEAENLKNHATEYYKKGDYMNALHYYTQAIQINPKVSIYFSNRARAYRRIGDFEKSTLDAQEAIELDESNIKAHYIMGALNSFEFVGYCESE